MNISKLHNEAMELADRAAVARIEGKCEEAIEFTKQAFVKEQAAARAVMGLAVEPTRSVLHRSAASLALECGYVREAERLIATALAGEPPNEIAEELRDLNEEVQFARHLDLRGIVLEPEEFQFSMTGNGVSFGVAESEDFVLRVKATEALVYRTAERRLHKPFREHGRRAEALAEQVALFMKVPRAASFAVTFKIGHPKQMELPGIELKGEFGAQIVDELLDCLDIYRSEPAKLDLRISDEAYRRNFIALADSLAPDGDRVKQVGFTSVRPLGERRVSLTRPRKRPDPLTAEERAVALANRGKKESQQIQGVLKAADGLAKTNTIHLKTQKGVVYRVIVPTGLMDDIVRPWWGQEVIITGKRTGNRQVLLEQIDPLLP